MVFNNYKNETLMTYRVAKREEYFIDIIVNSTYDKFALINNEYKMKIFSSNSKNVKIIYENLDLLQVIKNVQKSYKSDTIV